jgi:hypothetical protein
MARSRAQHAPAISADPAAHGPIVEVLGVTKPFPTPDGSQPSCSTMCP